MAVCRPAPDDARLSVMDLDPIVNAPTAAPVEASFAATPVMVGDARLVMITTWSPTGTHVVFYSTDGAIGMAEAILRATAFNTEQEAMASPVSLLELPPPAVLVSPDGAPLVVVPE